MNAAANNEDDGADTTFLDELYRALLFDFNGTLISSQYTPLVDFFSLILKKRKETMQHCQKGLFKDKSLS